MYAQLCLRLNDYAPIHSKSEDQQAGTFRKLLLHKCQEEFQNRRRATADLESRCGEVLSPEEEEQMALAKRKMLGNIKFVGELYKLGVLHEAIIHNCIKELLERRRGQSVEHTSQSVECLCHFMTTVGSKLDTSKAKSWMDQYFARMHDLSTNKDLPSRIRFMLMDVIELRKSNWVPRRVAADSSPRPIHLIRHELYQEKQGTGSGGRGHGGTGTSSTPPSTLELGQPEMRAGTGSSQYSGVSGDEGFTSTSYMQDTLSSPQDHAHMSFVSHAATPTMHSVMTPSPSDAVPAADAGKTAEKKKFRKLSSKSDNTVSLRPAMQSLKIGSSSSRNKLSSAATPTSVDHTLLQSDSVVPEGDLEKVPGKVVPVQKMHIPRTRDDSSDEEDRETATPSQGVIPGPPPMMSHIHMPPHPFPGGGNFPPPHHLPHHHHHMPPPHMMNPQQPLPPRLRGSPGVPEPFQSRAPRGLIGPGPLPPPPPHAMGNAGQGLLPHQPHPPMMYMGPPPPPGTRPLSGPPGIMQYPPPGPLGPPGPPITMSGPPRGFFTPRSTAGSPGHTFIPHGPPHIPGHVPGYGQMPRPATSHPSPGWSAPGQEMPRPPSNPTEHDGEKHSRPPNLERNEPVIKYKSSRKSGGTKKGAQDEKERMVDSLIKDYLRSRDVEQAVKEVKGQLSSIPKDSLCSMCITKTLEKSEDDRTHMSDLLQELHSRDLVTSQHLLQAMTTVINSSHSAESQNKMYLAGFIARAVAKDLLTLKLVCPLFDQGAHHPTVLVLLQALTALLGEMEVLERFKSSDLNLTMLLPVEYRSHSALSSVVESKHLSFLYPLKRIQSELAAKLKQEASAVPIYRWIRANVDSSLYPTADFVMVLTRCILEHVTSSSSLSPAAASSDTPSKDLVAKEKELMKKFKVLIEKFVSDKASLQVSVLYATQVFCHDKQFPKGLLLRIFSYWYDMDVIEEESFFKWKEDVPQEFPGKGQALFQVNQWLVLLAESDDEDASSDDES